MTPERKRQIMLDKNTRDFNTMRGMLTMIETKIMQVDPMKQEEFYQPLQRIIFEAWQDACDPNNEFLFEARPVPEETEVIYKGEKIFFTDGWWRLEVCPVYFPSIRDAKDWIDGGAESGLSDLLNGET